MNWNRRRCERGPAYPSRRVLRLIRGIQKASPCPHCYYWHVEGEKFPNDRRGKVIGPWQRANAATALPIGL